MRSRDAWREIPCIECGEFVTGINFADRCPSCLARRQRRANRLALRISIVATVAFALSSAWRLPASDIGRFYSALGVVLTFVLVRLIAKRVLMEVLK